VGPDVVDPGEITETHYFMNGSWASWNFTMGSLVVYISHQDAENLMLGITLWTGVCGVISTWVTALAPPAGIAMGFACATMGGLSHDEIGFLDADGGPGFIIVADSYGAYVQP
jgi:hypothetical protein